MKELMFTALLSHTNLTVFKVAFTLFQISGVNSGGPPQCPVMKNMCHYALIGENVCLSVLLGAKHMLKFPPWCQTYAVVLFWGLKP